MQAIVSINDLQVVHSRDTLLDIPKLDMYKGNQIAIVGGNGAGKTTFLETILGLRTTQCGKVFLQTDKHDLGVQLQNATYNPEMLVSDVISMHKCVYKKDNKALHSAFNLNELASKKYGKLSRGQKQRVDLYVAFAHQPSTIVLDEPGTGLDKRYNELFMNLIKRYKDNTQSTLLMASHSSRELSEASHILWIEKGKVVEFCPKDLMFYKHLGAFKASFSLTQEQDKDAILNEIRTYDGIQRTDISCEGIFEIYGDESIRKSVLTLIEAHDLENFSFCKTTAEDFLNLVSNKNNQNSKGE